mmetsp:Transcript_34177/g.105165  ORF Transcript_34177/g.105165 Transcript_34177/m.105165 type:complete len:106 (+) Transcript_34177:139-456(+)
MRHVLQAAGLAIERLAAEPSGWLASCSSSQPPRGRWPCAGAPPQLPRGAGARRRTLGLARAPPQAHAGGSCREGQTAVRARRQQRRAGGAASLPRASHCLSVLGS